MRRNLLVGILSFILIYTTQNCKAQDIHFSQFYNSPLTLNPALTGGFEGSYRLGANYRNQWAGIPPGTPFETFGGSADLTSPAPFLPAGTFGYGLQVFSDQSGLSRLTNQSVIASSAYHYPFLDGKHLASGGLQVGFVNKRFDISELSWGNQIRDTYIDNTAPTGESGLNNNFSYVDFNLGFHWAWDYSEKWDFYSGIALFHLSKPMEGFSNEGGKRISRRLAFHGGADYKLNDQVTIHPKFLWMQQNTDQEINLGGYAEYKLVNPKLKDVYLIFGLWGRSSITNSIVDAVIPSAGIRYKNVMGTLSYDLNVSSLNQLSNMKGGPEISIIYIGVIELLNQLNIEKTVPCIRY